VRDFGDGSDQGERGMSENVREGGARGFNNQSCLVSAPPRREERWRMCLRCLPPNLSRYETFNARLIN
jgi:hypothetical protein